MRDVCACACDLRQIKSKERKSSCLTGVSFTRNARTNNRAQVATQVHRKEVNDKCLIREDVIIIVDVISFCCT